MDFNLQDEVQALQDATYSIRNEVSARNIDSALDCAPARQAGKTDAKSFSQPPSTPLQDHQKQ